MLPGYIRIDTVHQGDQDKQKGVYHINAVDEVTQFEVICSVEKISEVYLLPVLEELLDTFPFVIINFHSVIMTLCAPPIADLGLTEMPQVMPEEYKDKNPVIAYRQYFITRKFHLAKWTARDVPQWFKK